MAAITLSGFNNIDFNAILEAVMTQERVPFTALGTKKAALQQQNTQLGTLAGKLATLRSAAEDLASADSLAVLKAVSSDATLVGVSTSSGSTSGVYDVKVTSRAKAQVTASTSTSAENDVVATGGSLSLLVAGQPPVDIVVSGSMTLRDLADAINATSDAPVSASVVQVTPGNYRLVLTSKETGVDNAFTFTSTLSGGTGVTFGGANATYGEAGDGNAVDAANAVLTVNNVAVESSSNTLTDVIPGATLTLNGEDATKTTQVTVTRDGEAMRTQVEDFAKAYNDLVKFMKDQQTAAINGSTNIARDPMVRALHTELRSTVLGAYGDGDLTRLAAVGIEFERDGTMSVDASVFADAIDSNPIAVQELFAGADGEDGAFDELEQLLAGYVDSDGLVKEARTRIQDQVQNISARMDVLDAQLAIRRETLHREFIAADQAMSRLNSQVNSLSALGGQYRLF